MERYDLVIIGGGIAGVSATRAVAESRRPVRTLLISAEDRPPYKRTKISKHIAAGFSKEDFPIESREWYEEHGIDLLLGVRVQSIDTDTHTIALSDGITVAFEKLIIATGGEACLPENAPRNHDRLHSVRYAVDVERLRRAFEETAKVLVVGMGVLGVEVAEQLAVSGRAVTLIGTSTAPMPRELNPRASQIMDGLFRGAGVSLQYGTRLESVSPSASSVTVRISGSAQEFDQVVFCVGMRPTCGLAIEAGIPTGAGILVDERLETRVPGIYACGDVAEHSGGYRTHLWHAAELQGEIAGQNALGANRPYERPTFRLKCEVFGHYFFSAAKPSDAEGCEIREYDDGTRYLCFYMLDNHLCGMVMVDDGENAKRYQEAVREKLSLAEIERRFLSPGALSAHA